MTYYQALELPENAPAADIRRAYRRLVLLTHPDRTPDPAAHARYLAVNAAYETLSDPARRQAYDLALHGTFTAPPPAMSPGRARDARRARRPPRPRRPAAPPDAHLTAQTLRALRLARPLLLASLVLCATLAIDLVFATERLEKVLQTEAERYLKVQHRTERGTFVLTEELPVGSRLWVLRTPIWRTAVAARFSPGEAPFTFRSVYRGASNSFWLGLVLSSLLALWPRISPDSRLISCLLSGLFLVLTLLQMFR